MMRTIVCAALLVLTAGLPEAREVTIPLEIVEGERCRFDARGAMLLGEVPGPGPDGLIAIEAEQPLRHYFDPNVRRADAPMPADSDAAGGAYLDQATFASYEFTADRAGEWWLWARVRGDAVGHYRFRDVVNGTVWYFFDEERKGGEAADDPPLGWHWVLRRKVNLRAGANHLEITRYGYSFPEIDRFVLAPAEDWQPEGLGPEVATAVPLTGWVQTAPITIPGLQRLVRIEGLPGQAGQVSLRAGDQWTPVHEGLRQSGMADLDIEPAEPVELRLTLTAASSIGGMGALALVAEVDDARWAELVSGRTRLVFDAQTAGLFLVQDTETGEALVYPSVARPQIALDFKLAGERRVVRVDPESVTEVPIELVENRGWVQQPAQPRTVATPPRSVEVGDNSLTATWVFAVEGMGRAAVTQAVVPEADGGFRIDVTVRHLEGPADVVAVTCPRIERCRIGRSGLDDIQFRMQSFGHETVQPGYQPIRDESYSGGVVMPWQEIYDERLGLYVGAHDPQAYNCLFTSQAGGLAAEQFSFALRKLDDIKPGEERTYPFVLMAHAGPWHDGARRYGSWFDATFGRAQYPDWMRAMDGWLNFGAMNTARGFHFSALPGLFTEARAIGLDWLQVWGQFAYDWGPCCHDWTEPSPAFGGREAWAAAAREIVGRGGYVGGYFIYDRLDRLPIATDWYLGHFRKSEYPPDTPWPSSDFYARMQLVSDPGGVAEPWPPPQAEIDAKLAEVEAHQETYAKGERAAPVMWWHDIWCNDPQWWEYLRGWIVDRYARQWSSNACYIDVLGTGGAEVSYDPARGHNGEGSWGMGRLGIARTIVEDARSVFADYAATMEGMGDLPGLYCASMCSGVYRGGRNVMRYTFPDRIFIHGLANAGSGGETMDRYAETFLEGMRYDFTGMPHAEGIRFLELQRAFTPWLYEARFMDTDGVGVSDPRVKLRRFDLQGSAEGCLLTVLNRERLPGQRITIDEQRIGPVRAGFIVSIDGVAEALELQRDAQALSFAAPEALAAMVLLVRDASEDAALWPVIHQVRFGEPQIALTLLNLSGTAQSGTCRLANLGFPEPYEAQIEAAQEALPLAQTELPFTVEAGAAQTLRFPVQSLRRQYYTVRLGATIARDGRPEIAREFLALPFALDGSFEGTGETSDLAVVGSKVLELGPTTEGYLYGARRLWLEPGHRYRISVQARRTGFTARVHSTAITMATETRDLPIVRANMDTTRPNEWQTLSYELETPPDFTRAQLYLYNVESPDTAWFDDVLVEDLGPV